MDPRGRHERPHILVEKCPPVGPCGPLKSRLSALACSDALRPMGTYLPVPRFPGGDLGGGGGCLAGGFLAVDVGAAAGVAVGVGAGAALGRSLAASLAIFLAGFSASAAALVGAAFTADWFAWAG